MNIDRTTRCAWWRRPVIVAILLLFYCCCVESVALNSKLLMWCFTTGSVLHLLYSKRTKFQLFPFALPLKVYCTMYFLSECVCVSVCALLLYLAFLFHYFFKPRALYTHCSCFCKQLCSIDLYLVLALTIYDHIVTFAHTQYRNHQTFFFSDENEKIL